MVNIERIESEIVNKLRSDISGLSIEAYPDSPSNYHVRHPKGAVLVHYSGSRFQPSVYDEFIAQIQQITFDIILIVRSLRGNGGAYEVMDQIRESLTGFVMTDISKFQPTEEEFITEENGIWQYGMRFSAKTKHLE
jgi:hypothetical protein